MRKRKFTYLDFKHIEDWHNARHRHGLGGSEVGTIFSLNPYESKGELFWRKIQPQATFKPPNKAMLMGQLLEDYVADLWQYWDGEWESNFIEGKKVRRCRKINKMVLNPEYDWLYANIDREILSTSIHGKQGILECKNYSKSHINRYEEGIAPSSIFQINTYMLVMEANYAELAMKLDGNDFDVSIFTPMDDFQEMIIKATKIFWDLVKEGRSIMSSDLTYDQKQERIAQIEPEPEGTEIYEMYLKERFKADNQKQPIAGTPELLKTVKELVKYKEKEKEVHKEVLLRENQLKNTMRESEVIAFEHGNCSWKEDSNGTRRFNIQKKLLNYVNTTTT